MITANDLKNIDTFLYQQMRIINQPAKDKELLVKLRHKISIELSKIEIRVK